MYTYIFVIVHTSDLNKNSTLQSLLVTGRNAPQRWAYFSERQQDGKYLAASRTPWSFGICLIWLDSSHDPAECGFSFPDVSSQIHQPQVCLFRKLPSRFINPSRPHKLCHFYIARNCHKNFVHKLCRKHTQKCIMVLRNCSFSLFRLQNHLWFWVSTISFVCFWMPFSW